MRERFIGRSVVRRLPGLLAGLALFGAGIAVMAPLGPAPADYTIRMRTRASIATAANRTVR